MLYSGDQHERQSKKIFPGRRIFRRRLFKFDRNSARRNAKRPERSPRHRARPPPQPLQWQKRTAAAAEVSRSLPPHARARPEESPARNGRRRESLQAHRRAREMQNRALQNHRRLGLQRLLPRPHHPSPARRTRPHHFRKPPARIHVHPLARPRSSHRPGRRPVAHAKAHRPRRKIHLRIHRPSGRHFLLPLPRRHARNDGHDRLLRRASGTRLQTPRRSRFRRHPARVGRPPKQHRPQHFRHGIQLAHLQRRLRSRHHPDDCAPRQPRPPPHHQHGHGPSPYPSPRQSIRHHRNRRRPRPRIHLVSDEHRSSRRSASPRRRVRRQISRRVDGPLPSPAPHDEQHDGSSPRSRHRNRQYHRRKSPRANGNARQQRPLRTCPPLPHRRKRQHRPRLPARRLHGNGHGRRRSKTRNPRPPAQLERRHDGHDDRNPRPPRPRLRRNDAPNKNRRHARTKGADPCFIIPSSLP